MRDASRPPAFADRFSRASIANYGGVIHREAVSFVADPLGSGRRIIRMDVPDSAVGPTPNPRCQMSSPAVLIPEVEVWAAFAVLFPSGTGPTAGVTPFPPLPPGNSGFVNITQFYTSRPTTSPAVKLGFRAGAGRELMWQRNAVSGSDRPWRLGHNVELDRWYEFAWHVRLASDPARGFAELWMRTSTVGGWMPQTLFADTPHETTRVSMQTIDPGAGAEQPIRHDIQLYRRAGMFDTVSVYFAGHRVGSSLEEVDPGVL